MLDRQLCPKCKLWVFFFKKHEIKADLEYMHYNHEKKRGLTFSSASRCSAERPSEIMRNKL